MFQLIGYALLDFDDYQITELGIFAYLTTWPLNDLLTEMAGHDVDIVATCDAFRQLLQTARRT